MKDVRINTPYCWTLNCAKGTDSAGAIRIASLDRCIGLDNAVIGNHPGIVFALHVCRGNYQRKFFGRGDYGPIAAKLFCNTHFQRFLLEYDDERSGGFEPLQYPGG